MTCAAAVVLAIQAVWFALIWFLFAAYGCSDDTCTAPPPLFSAIVLTVQAVLLPLSLFAAVHLAIGFIHRNDYWR